MRTAWSCRSWPRCSPAAVAAATAAVPDGFARSTGRPSRSPTPPTGRARGRNVLGAQGPEGTGGLAPQAASRAGRAHAGLTWSWSLPVRPEDPSRKLEDGQATRRSRSRAPKEARHDRGRYDEVTGDVTTPVRMIDVHAITEDGSSTTSSFARPWPTSTTAAGRSPRDVPAQVTVPGALAGLVTFLLFGFGSGRWSRPHARRVVCRRGQRGRTGGDRRLRRGRRRAGAWQSGRLGRRGGGAVLGPLLTSRAEPDASVAISPLVLVIARPWAARAIYLNSGLRDRPTLRTGSPPNQM